MRRCPCVYTGISRHLQLTVVARRTRPPRLDALSGRRAPSVASVSRGLGHRQREILAELAAHRDHPRDFDAHLRREVDLARAAAAVAAVDRGQPAHHHRTRVEEAEHHAARYADRYPEWLTVRELAGLRPDDTHTANRPDVEATRRAVRALEAAGLVEVRTIHRNERGQAQLGVRLV